MFSQACVIPFCPRGGGVSASEGGVRLGGSASGGCLHPGGGVGRPPQSDTMDMVNERAVRIILECILVTICVLFKIFIFQFNWHDINFFIRWAEVTSMVGPSDWDRIENGPKWAHTHWLSISIPFF